MNIPFDFDFFLFSIGHGGYQSYLTDCHRRWVVLEQEKWNVMWGVHTHSHDQSLNLNDLKPNAFVTEPFQFWSLSWWCVGWAMYSIFQPFSKASSRCPVEATLVYSMLQKVNQKKLDKAEEKIKQKQARRAEKDSTMPARTWVVVNVVTISHGVITLELHWTLLKKAGSYSSMLEATDDGTMYDNSQSFILHILPSCVSGVNQVWCELGSFWF